MTKAQKNEYWKSRIEQGKKDTKGLKLYEMGIVCEDLKEEIEKKDKMIDLMADEIGKLITCPLEDYNCDLDCENKCRNQYKDCWKQYFEKKAEQSSGINKTQEKN